MTSQCTIMSTPYWTIAWQCFIEQSIINFDIIIFHCDKTALHNDITFLHFHIIALHCDIIMSQCDTQYSIWVLQCSPDMSQTPLCYHNTWCCHDTILATITVVYCDVKVLHYDITKVCVFVLVSNLSLSPLPLPLSLFLSFSLQVYTHTVNFFLHKLMTLTN